MTKRIPRLTTAELTTLLRARTCRGTMANRRIAQRLKRLGYAQSFELDRTVWWDVVITKAGRERVRLACGGLR